MSSFRKAHRNDVDDPTLEDEPEGKDHSPNVRGISTGATQQTGGSGTAAAGGGSSILAADQIPQLIARAQGKYTVGGQYITLTLAGGLSPFVTALEWRSADGCSRKGILSLVTGGFTTANVTKQQIAVFCLVTMGSARGSVKFWAMAPVMIPLEASYIRVDAMLSVTPFQLASNTGGPTIVPAAPVTVGGTNTFTGQLAANWFDDTAEQQLPPAILGASLQACQSTAASGSLAQFPYPCIVRSIELCNANAVSGVWIVAADTLRSYSGAGGVNLAQVKGAIWCPPQSTIAVGEGLLGTFGAGVSLFGVTSPAGSQGTAWTEDANDANVFATIKGIYLQQGS